MPDLKIKFTKTRKEIADKLEHDLPSILLSFSIEYAANLIFVFRQGFT